MRKTLFILSLILVVLNSCKDDTPTHTIGIDIQANFQQDDVQVYLDGKKVIDGEFETNLSTGVAGAGFERKKTEGNHEIRIVVNETHTKIETFSIENSDLYIGVGFNQDTGVISFTYSPTRFLYD